MTLYFCSLSWNLLKTRLKSLSCCSLGNREDMSSTKGAAGMPLGLVSVLLNSVSMLWSGCGCGCVVVFV